MSDRMRPIPFDKLINWVLTEEKTNSVFGVRKMFQQKDIGGQQINLLMLELQLVLMIGKMKMLGLMLECLQVVSVMVAGASE